MRTIGIDLAAEPGKTALAVIDWTPGSVEVIDLRIGVTDAAIVEVTKGASCVGIDAPFGWPHSFVEFVVAHHDQRPLAITLETRDERRPLTKRRTDLFVQDHVGVVPLSVSADRIAHVALRCAGILAKLGVTDRAGGPVVEVYPAAALRQWGLPYRGYKTDPVALLKLVEKFEEKTSWLDLGQHRQKILTSDDAFDSVISALIARAVVTDQVFEPSGSDRDAATREGWIQIPSGRLDDLNP